MFNLPHPDPAGQAPYVTLTQTRTGLPFYAPVIVTTRGRRNAPINIRRHTVRNVLSVAMSYAAAKGLPFRLEHAELAAEAEAVKAELAAQYGIEVEVAGCPA